MGVIILLCVSMEVKALGLYRAFLRAVPHSYPSNPAARDFVRHQVRQQFRLHQHESDPDRREALLQSAEERLNLIRLSIPPLHRPSPFSLPSAALRAQAETEAVAPHTLRGNSTKNHTKNTSESAAASAGPKSANNAPITKSSSVPSSGASHDASYPSSSTAAWEPRSTVTAMTVTEEDAADERGDSTHLNVSSFIPHSGANNQGALNERNALPTTQGHQGEALNASYVDSLIQEFLRTGPDISLSSARRAHAKEAPPLGEVGRWPRPHRLNTTSFIPPESYELRGIAGRTQAATRISTPPEKKRLNRRYMDRLVARFINSLPRARGRFRFRRKNKAIEADADKEADRTKPLFL